MWSEIATPCREGAASEPTPVTSAAVVHAAAALYLGLGGRTLRDALAVGFSLADVAEWQGQSLEGLGRAIVNAVRRTAGPAAFPDAGVDEVLNVAEEGWGAWQATVDRLMATRSLRPWPATAA